MHNLYFPTEIYQYIALNFGLLILAAWFYILLLILREFRHFATTMVKHKPSMQDEDILRVCRESVDNALSYVNDNSETISQLAQIQQTLEQQLAEIRSSTQDRMSKQEAESIKALNQKLVQSHALIRKLKGDLDQSTEKLKRTRQKLYSQYDEIETLQKEHQELQEKYQAIQEQAQASPQNAQGFEQEKAQMSEIINNYKRQIAEQNQALEQLSLQADTSSDSDLDQIKTELEQTKAALKHLKKEKNFIESRYLEITKTKDQ
ncbi:chromosome partitioning protein ParA [Pseudoalteromonas sp. MMG022]|uniref:chromosome partitioning protein ParA n=1 Tax=Pseudoalteromonas sp. MMG022 TaxID=2909978 RepID=UPI001F40B48A|nr:chromosome partitioning protein ParA [Pseudoalteromonas sp. MMG022]MCF6434475.1 chromosome partitioning protein ParA [Pseudoalteromonas sp. MMG022]